MQREPELKTCSDVINYLKQNALLFATNKRAMREADAERIIGLILLLSLLPE